MPLCSIDEAIADIRQGKMIILVDDEGRENEGDLTMAAEHVTPEAINFMAKFGRGLICLPMAPEIIDKLQLPLMTQRNGSRFGTNFTISIEAREGVTTGISAADQSVPAPAGRLFLATHWATPNSSFRPAGASFGLLSCGTTVAGCCGLSGA